MRSGMFFAALTLASTMGATAGCGPKVAGPVALDAPAQAAVVGLLAPMDGELVQPLPDRVAVRLDALLAARNLTPRGVADGAADLSRLQTTGQRAAWLAEHADGAQYVVLVETAATYTTQIEGRFRWTVDVTATIAPASDPGAGASKTFRVPVFLQFAHEKEAAAVAEAAVVIERQVGRHLDQWLGGR